MSGKKLYVFIDASNLWAVQKSKGKTLDLAKLKKFLKDKHKASAIKVYYYDAYPKPETRDHDVSGKHRFYVYLEKALGFVVRKKPLKQIRVETERGVAVEEKGNMDVEMAIDIVNQSKNYDEAAILSGDSDFSSTTEVYSQQKQKGVYIYSSRNNISSELRTGGDGYTDILKISADIWRDEVRRRAK
jgi:uncharacterized LabA/DUF88 family protein